MEILRINQTITMNLIITDTNVFFDIILIKTYLRMISLKIISKIDNI